MEMYPTFSALIDALGGSAALADIIEKPLGTASAMKTRDTIPPIYWGAIVRHAKTVGLDGVSYEGLSRLYASRRERVA